MDCVLAIGMDMRMRILTLENAIIFIEIGMEYIHQYRFLKNNYKYPALTKIETYRNLLW